MKKAITILFLSFFSLLSTAQAPDWAWAKSGAGPVNSLGMAFSTGSDAAGNVYTAGTFIQSTITFDTIVLTNTTPGKADIFLTKYNAAGAVIWAKCAGGNRDDDAFDLATDALGNIYVTGYFASPAISFGTTTLTNADPSGLTNDIFLVKYNSAGAVQWARRAGNSSNDIASSIATDTSGNVYITGQFTGFSINFGTVHLNLAGSTPEGIFTVKYDASGTALWAQGVAEASSFWSYGGIGVDYDNNVYTMASFMVPAIYPGPFTITNIDPANNTADILTLKYNSGGTLSWAKRAGGDKDEQPYGFAVDHHGNCYLTGNYKSAAISFGGSTLINSDTSKDIFILKYDSTGTELWGKSMGGAGDDFGQAAALDNSGNLYMTAGAYSSVNTIDGVTILNSNSFIAKFNSSGTATWGIGTTINADCYDIHVDLNNEVIVAGNFLDTLNWGTIELYAPGFDVLTAKTMASDEGVQEHSLPDNGDVSIFPNPSSGVFTFSSKFKVQSLKVMNVFGQEINRQQATGNCASIDLTKFARGIYFVQITDEKRNTINKKIIIQ